MQKPNIAIVYSKFNSEITEPMLSKALARFEEKGLQAVEVFKVPGAIEIPLVAKKLAEKKCFEAILVLGAVIQGETDHYQYVCEQVSQGCQKVMLETGVPILFGVLTTQTEKLAVERIERARDLADSTLEMIEIFRQLDRL